MMIFLKMNIQHRTLNVEHRMQKNTDTCFFLYQIQHSMLDVHLSFKYFGTVA